MHTGRGAGSCTTSSRAKLDDIAAWGLPFLVAVGEGLGAALLGDLLTACTADGIRQVVAMIADTGSDASTALHHSTGWASPTPAAGSARC